MKKLFALLMIPVLGFAGLMGSTHAQLNQQNSYVDPTVSPVVDISLPKTESGQQDGLVNVVKGGVNWVLGILGLVALIVLLWGGLQMVTAAGDEEKYKKGFTILKQAAIGLILIGVAWFIISIIFWLVNITTNSSTPAGTSS